MNRILFVAVSALLGILSLVGAPQAQACDPGSYYDPTHQICQPSPPAYQPPGYGPPQVNWPGPTLPPNSRQYPY